MTINTPSGHVVEFKDKLTFGDRRSVKAVMLEGMKMDMENGKAKPQPISGKIDMLMEEQIFRCAIVSIKLEGKTPATGDLLDVVYSWDDADGQAVFDYLNKNFDPLGTTTEKKTA